MRNLAIRLVVIAVAVLAVAYFVWGSKSVTGLPSAILFALMVGALNALVNPALGLFELAADPGQPRRTDSGAQPGAIPAGDRGQGGHPRERIRGGRGGDGGGERRQLRPGEAGSLRLAPFHH